MVPIRQRGAIRQLAAAATTRASVAEICGKVVMTASRPGLLPPRQMLPWQKKGRPYGRPCIALDCCAPYMHPCTPETSLQLALPAPINRISTSLSASLLKINICQHQNSVKQIMIFFDISLEIVFITIIYSELRFYLFFKILKKINDFGPTGHRFPSLNRGNRHV